MMSQTTYLVVDRESGLVTNAVVGKAPSDDGVLVVRRSGKAANAWIGWSRGADGAFSPPPGLQSDGDADSAADA